MTLKKKESRRKRLNKLIERAGWTHAETAEAMKLKTRVTVSRWVCGMEQISESRLDHLEMLVEMREAQAELEEVIGV